MASIESSLSRRDSEDSGGSIVLEVVLERHHGSVESIGIIRFDQGDFAGSEPVIAKSQLSPYSLTYERARGAVLATLSPDVLPPHFAFVVKKLILGRETICPIGARQESIKRLGPSEHTIQLRTLTPMRRSRALITASGKDFNVRRSLVPGTPGCSSPSYDGGTWRTYPKRSGEPPAADSGSSRRLLILNSERELSEGGSWRNMRKDADGRKLFSWIVFVVRDRVDGDRRVSIAQSKDSEDLSSSLVTTGQILLPAECSFRHLRRQIEKQLNPDLFPTDGFEFVQLPGEHDVEENPSNIEVGLVTDEAGTTVHRPKFCDDDDDSAGIFVRPVWLPGKSPMELAAKAKAERIAKRKAAEEAAKKKESKACVLL